MRFHAQKDIAICGLACVLCSSEDCPGCKARGCADGGDCSVYQCATGKGLDGCCQCADYPCEEKMLQGIRNRAFNRYAREFGKQALIDRLRINYESGITYHKPDGLQGDYDVLTTEEDIMRLLRFGPHDPYVKCPVLEAEHFTLRLVRMEDAEDLLKCYSDPKAQQIFNADNCTSDFRYQTLGEMRDCIRFWIDCYNSKGLNGSGFVRFSIIDKKTSCAVGTIEMFRSTERFDMPWGLLRLDIGSAYEKQEYMTELLSLCTSALYDLFDVERMITKASPIAHERVAALCSAGFTPFDWQEPNRPHYWVRGRG